MIYYVVLTSDGETAKLKCDTYEEAQKVYRAFMNHGKYDTVTIERVDDD